MKEILHTYKADGYLGQTGDSVNPLVLIFDLPPVRLNYDNSNWEGVYRAVYAQAGEKVVAALLAHAPGGLVDAIFAALAQHKASLLRVSHLSESEAREVSALSFD